VTCGPDVPAGVARPWLRLSWWAPPQHSYVMVGAITAFRLPAMALGRSVCRAAGEECVAGAEPKVNRRAVWSGAGEAAGVGSMVTVVQLASRSLTDPAAGGGEVARRAASGAGPGP
jgi:hypothetical protein